MFAFLLIVQSIVAASLVGVILMQRSEGGGLGGRFSLFDIFVCSYLLETIT